jgi:hypothetical protein
VGLVEVVVGTTVVGATAGVVAASNMVTQLDEN